MHCALQCFDDADDDPTYGLSEECTSMDRHFDVEVCLGSIYDAEREKLEALGRDLGVSVDAVVANYIMTENGCCVKRALGFMLYLLVM